VGFDSKNQPHLLLSLHLIVRVDWKIKKPLKISGFLGKYCGLITLSVNFGKPSAFKVKNKFSHDRYVNNCRWDCIIKKSEKKTSKNKTTK
tara:strand:+ start:363 stop:632 length:270 start_codon:yes stop_codon:yes gene_type:complete